MTVFLRDTWSWSICMGLFWWGDFLEHFFVEFFFLVVSFTCSVLVEIAQATRHEYLGVVVKHLGFVHHVLLMSCNSVDIVRSVMCGKTYMILFVVNNVKEFSEHGVLFWWTICHDSVNKYTGLEIYVLSFALNNVRWMCNMWAKKEMSRQCQWNESTMINQWMNKFTSESSCIWNLVNNSPVDGEK